MSLIFTCCLLYNYFIRYRHFKIIESTACRILTGAKHSHNFISYRIKLKTKRASHKLVFDELWIEDRLYKIKITDEDNRHIANQFSEKQVLYIDSVSEINYTEDKIPPSGRSKIYLGYQFDNKRKYIAIKESAEEIPELLVA